MIRKIRWTLIKWLAGRDMIAINLIIGRNGSGLTVGSGSCMLVHGTVIESMRAGVHSCGVAK